MKKSKEILFWLFAVLPLIITTCFMPFLPDKVPTHYNVHGKIDRYGSKFTYFIIAISLCAIIVVLRLSVAYIMKKPYSSDKEKAHALSNAKVLFYLGMGISAFESIIIFVVLYSAYLESKTGSATAKLDINKIVVMAFGIAFILMGNILPKTRLNGTIGIRTKWSMANEKTWAATHQTGGIMMIIAGIVTFIVGILAKETFAIIGLLVVIGIMTVALVVYSYVVYKKYGD